MRSWPLRNKIAGLAVAVAGLAVLIFGAASAIELHRAGIRELDAEMRTAADILARRLSQRTEPVLWEIEPIESLLPLSDRIFHLEIEQPAGTLVYRCDDLRGESMPAQTTPDFRNITLLDTQMRMGVFVRNGMVIRLAANMFSVRETLTNLLVAYVIALPFVVLTIWWGARVLARNALAPIEEIAAAAARITAQRLDQRLPVPPSEDEVAHLTHVLNEMIDRLERSFHQAIRFTADASHELRTPLTIIRGEVEAALRAGGLSPQQERLLLSVLDETNRLSAISKTLLLLSRADAGKLVIEKEPVDITKLTELIMEDAEILASQRNVTVEKSVPANVVVSGNEQFLQQLILNLVDNAVKYGDPGGVVRLQVSVEGDHCTISVSNKGQGIAPEDVPLIFERFHRGEPSRNRESGGHGLGLAICREIARAHSGDITVHLDQPGWTEFRVTLPLDRGGRSV